MAGKWQENGRQMAGKRQAKGKEMAVKNTLFNFTEVWQVQGTKN